MSSDVSADAPGQDDPGQGRRLGVDVGSVRIGVAVSDPSGILATPVETVARSSGGRSAARAHRDLDRLAELCNEYEVVEVVVGLPTTLRGEHGAAAVTATSFARELRRRVAPVPVRMSDERFTTVTASHRLRDSGVRARDQRSVIDQAAAVAILQGWLDARARALTFREADEFGAHGISDDERTQR